MNKPNSLRSHLLQHIPELQHDPDRLLTFIENGKIRCTAAVGLSFEYEYQLQLIITDYAGHPDTVMIPLLDWLRTHQHELLANYDKNRDGIQFDAEIMANDLVDLSITLPLSERVIVKPVDGGLSVTHPPEPQLTDHYPQQRYDLIMDDESVASWQSAAPRWHDIETPHPKPRS
jgi:hypothetical protein